MRGVRREDRHAGRDWRRASLRQKGRIRDKGQRLKDKGES